MRVRFIKKWIHGVCDISRLLDCSTVHSRLNCLSALKPVTVQVVLISCSTKNADSVARVRARRLVTNFYTKVQMDVRRRFFSTRLGLQLHTRPRALTRKMATDEEVEPLLGESEARSFSWKALGLAVAVSDCEVARKKVSRDLDLSHASRVVFRCTNLVIYSSPYTFRFVPAQGHTLPAGLTHPSRVPPPRGAHADCRRPRRRHVGRVCDVEVGGDARGAHNQNRPCVARVRFDDK